MRYIKLDEICQSLKNFSPNMAVTHGQFEFNVAGFLEDMEWNHMDQLHRPHIHNTYQEAIRIACGRDFAISLTRWGKFPFFIMVSDVRIKPGLFYQCMTIAGFFYIHFIISMFEKNEVVYSKLEWYITSTKWFKFFHKFLHKKFLNLNKRLQEEDSQIRTQRYALRKKGYSFSHEPISYYNANKLKLNTIYPNLMEESSMDVSQQNSGSINIYYVGEIGFLVKKVEGEYLIWPQICPHEGANLALGKECDEKKIKCPWHGLRFSAIVLSTSKPRASGYGFQFLLVNKKIHINKNILAITNGAQNKETG